MSRREEKTEGRKRSRAPELEAFDASLVETRRNLERWRKALRALIQFAESDEGRRLFSRQVVEAAKRVVRESERDRKGAP